MRRRLAVGLMVCGTMAAPDAVPAADPPSAGECFVAAFKANDAAAVAACYAEDGIIWFPGGPMAQGRDAIRDGFAHYLEAFEIKDARLTQMGTSAAADTRTAWGTYAITSVHKASGKASVETGRYVDVQKLIDGRWLYVVDHPSGDPAPAAGTSTP